MSVPKISGESLNSFMSNGCTVGGTLNDEWAYRTLLMNDLTVIAHIHGNVVDRCYLIARDYEDEEPCRLCGAPVPPYIKTLAKLVFL